MMCIFKTIFLIFRIKSLERDNAQKRILAEDMRMKMKVVQENAKSDTAVMVCKKTLFEP